MVGEWSRPIEFGNLFEAFSNVYLGLGDLVPESLDGPVLVLREASGQFVHELILGPTSGSVLQPLRLGRLRLDFL